MVVKWSPLPVRSAGEVHDNLYFGLKAKTWGHMVQKSVEFECANLVQSTESWYTCCVSDRKAVWTVLLSLRSTLSFFVLLINLITGERYLHVSETVQEHAPNKRRFPDSTEGMWQPQKKNSVKDGFRVRRVRKFPHGCDPCTRRGSISKEM